MTGRELRDRRVSLGVTQVRLAALAMVTTRTLQYWEAGKYDIPLHRQRMLEQSLRAIERQKPKGVK